MKKKLKLQYNYYEIFKPEFQIALLPHLQIRREYSLNNNHFCVNCLH